MLGHEDRNCSSKRTSPIYILLRLALLVAFIAWLALAASAWRYFSGAGWSSIPLSARYGVTIALLPPDIWKESYSTNADRSEEPLRLVNRLSKAEIEKLASKGQVDFRDSDSSELVGGWTRDSSNQITFSGLFREHYETDRTTYFVRDREICFLDTRPVCLTGFKDDNDIIHFWPIAHSASGQNWLLMDGTI